MFKNVIMTCKNYSRTIRNGCKSTVDNVLSMIITCFLVDNLSKSIFNINFAQIVYGNQIERDLKNA